MSTATVEATTININEITRDAGTQARHKLDGKTVDEYRQLMEDGRELPPVVVFDDGNECYLADGFHRVVAAEQAGYEDIPAEIREGTRQDAVAYAVQANTHGLPRSNADKRKAVEMALSEWPNMSDNETAKLCAVTHPTVAAVRRDMSGEERKTPQRPAQKQNKARGGEGAASGHEQPQEFDLSRELESLEEAVMDRASYWPDEHKGQLVGKLTELRDRVKSEG